MRGVIQDVDRQSTVHCDDIEPLEPGHWMGRFRQLAMWPLADDAEFERALRHAFHLVQLAPRPLRHIIDCEGSEAEFEAFLETRAFEAAVVRLLGNHTLYSLVHSSDEQEVTAEVWYSDQDVRHRATAQSAAWALFRAWLECTKAMSGTDEPERNTDPSTLIPGEASTEH